MAGLPEGAAGWQLSAPCGLVGSEMYSQAHEFMGVRTQAHLYIRMATGTYTHTHRRRAAQAQAQAQAGGANLAQPCRHSRSAPASVFSVEETLRAAGCGGAQLAGSGEGKLKFTEPVTVRGRLLCNPNLRL